MENLIIPVEDYESKQANRSASDYVTSKSNAFTGFGKCGYISTYDPTLSLEDRHSFKLSSCFSLSMETCPRGDVDKCTNALYKSIVVHQDLSSAGEEPGKGLGPDSYGKSLTVQQNHLAYLSIRMKYLKILSLKVSDANCGFGLVTGDSKPDAYFMDGEDHARGIFEVKNGSCLPLEAIRQGLSEASNVAIHQRNLGVAVNDIIVPVVGSNGYLIQFGVVILYDDSFPVAILVSEVLNLRNEEQRKEAVRLFCCCQRMFEKPLHVALKPTTTTKIRLSTRLFHFKLLKDFFKVTENLQTSLAYYFDVMSRLMRYEACRQFIVFPICVREYLDDNHFSSIVFPMLSSKEYKIGLPDDKAMRELLLRKLAVAMATFHAMHIVHFDLYLSNILWKPLGSSDIEIKVIDWDSAQFVDLDIHEAVRSRWTPSRKKLQSISLIQDGLASSDNLPVALMHFDISLWKVIEFSLHDESLRVRTKACLDANFIISQDKYLQHYLSV
jgi:hypothetical protein